MVAPPTAPNTVAMSDSPPGVERRSVREVTHPITSPKQSAPTSMMLIMSPTSAFDDGSAQDITDRYFRSLVSRVMGAAPSPILEGFMKRTCMIAALTVVLFGVAC